MLFDNMTDSIIICAIEPVEMLLFNRLPQSVTFPIDYTLKDIRFSVRQPYLFSSEERKFLMIFSPDFMIFLDEKIHMTLWNSNSQPFNNEGRIKQPHKKQQQESSQIIIHSTKFEGESAIFATSAHSSHGAEASHIAEASWRTHEVEAARTFISKASSSSPTEEHLEDFVGVDLGSAESAHACSWIAVIFHLPRVIQFLFLRVRKNSIGFSNLFEFLLGIGLLSLAFVSIFVWVVFHGQSPIGLFEVGVRTAFLDAQSSIVVLLLGASLQFLGVFDLVPHVGRRIQLLNFAVIHSGSSVLLALHLDISSPGIGLHVIRIKLQRFVEIVESLKPILSFHKGQGSVGIDYSIQFFVGGVQSQRLSVFLSCFGILALLNEIISLLLQLLALFSAIESQPALSVVWVLPHSLLEQSLGLGTIAPVEFYDTLEVETIRASSIDVSELGFGIIGVSGLGQHLNLHKFQSFIFGDLGNQIIRAHECFVIILLLATLCVFLEVLLEALAVLIFISDCLVLVQCQSLFKVNQGVVKIEQIHLSQSFSSVGLRKFGVNVQCLIAILHDLLVALEVQVAGGSVSKIARLIVVQADGFGVACNSICIVFIFEGFIAFLFPLVSGLRHSAVYYTFSQAVSPIQTNYYSRKFYINVVTNGLPTSRPVDASYHHILKLYFILRLAKLGIVNTNQICSLLLRKGLYSFYNLLQLWNSKDLMNLCAIQFLIEQQLRNI